MAPLLRDAAERGIRYLEGLDARSVAPAPDAIEGLARFDEPLPAGPSDPAEVLRMLDDVGSPATVAIAGGRFFGFVIGGALPVTVAANWLASAWDQNTSLWNITPGAAALEEVALSWMIELFGLPKETGGAFVTGATVANFTGLAAARHAVLARAGWDVEAQGLFG
ncbi:MAG: aspartate aminotransferase family protein, partial [Candidatus Eisenbacteria bacterium]